MMLGEWNAVTGKHVRKEGFNAAVGSEPVQPPKSDGGAVRRGSARPEDERRGQEPSLRAAKPSGH